VREDLLVEIVISRHGIFCCGMQYLYYFFT